MTACCKIIWRPDAQPQSYHYSRDMKSNMGILEFIVHLLSYGVAQIDLQRRRLWK